MDTDAHVSQRAQKKTLCSYRHLQADYLGTWKQTQAPWAVPGLAQLPNPLDLEALARQPETALEPRPLPEVLDTLPFSLRMRD